MCWGRRTGEEEGRMLEVRRPRSAGRGPGAPTTPPPGWPGPAGRLPSARLPRGNLDSPPTAGADPGVLGGKPQRGGRAGRPAGFSRTRQAAEGCPAWEIALCETVTPCWHLSVPVYVALDVESRGGGRRAPEGGTDRRKDGRKGAALAHPLFPGRLTGPGIGPIKPRTHEATVEAAENVGFVQLVPDGSPVKTWKSAFQRFPLILLLG